MLVVIVGGGTTGYMLVEDWSAWDAFYMTVTTVTTVGFREVRELSRPGQIFTVILIIAGVGGALYTLNVLVRLTLEGELTGALAQRRMRRRMARMQDHIILCGFGRVGEAIAATLTQRNQHFVVIEQDQRAVALVAAAGYQFVQGDATRDETLQEGGIDRARCLITALNSDADNSWVILSARALNPKLWIVARADHPGSEGKLRQAGANRVVAPASIAGGHMALAAVQPLLLDYTETLVRSHGQDLTLAQLTVEPGAALDGLALTEAIAAHPSVTVLGVRRADGELLVKPEPSVVLLAGDQLIVLGRMDDLAGISARMRTAGGDAVQPAMAQS